MKFFILLLLVITPIAWADTTIMSYYQPNVGDEYVVVYGYYQSNGVFTLSHCRTTLEPLVYDVETFRKRLSLRGCYLGPESITSQTRQF